MTVATVPGFSPVERLALRVFLSRARFELKPYEPLVANHPRIVTGLDHVRITRPELDLRAILVSDGQAPFVNNADVSCLAAVGSRNRFDALRPTPPRLEGEASRARVAHPYDLYPRLVGSPCLVR